MKKFSLLFGQSSRKMILKGSLGEMSYTDLSGFPYTIIEEQEEYTKRDSIMKAIDSSRDMMEF